MTERPGDIDSVNHVGVAVRDLDRASALYEALGFVTRREMVVTVLERV